MPVSPGGPAQSSAVAWRHGLQHELRVQQSIGVPSTSRRCTRINTVARLQHNQPARQAIKLNLLQCHPHSLLTSRFNLTQSTGQTSLASTLIHERKQSLIASTYHLIATATSSAQSLRFCACLLHPGQ